MAGNLGFAWEVLTQNFNPVHVETFSGHSTVQTAVDTLKQHGIDNIIEEWFWDNLQKDLRERVSSIFWSHFKKTESTKHTGIVDTFSRAICELYSQLTHHMSCCDKIQWLREYIEPDKKYHDEPKHTAQIYFKAILFFVPPKYFHDIIFQFYTRAFRVYHVSAHAPDDVTDSDCCEGCEFPLVNCKCKEIMDKFHTVNRQLNEVGLLERISGEAVTTIIHKRIKDHIQQVCKGNFESSRLEMLETWLNTVVLNWLGLVYTQEGTSLGAFKDRLFHYMYQTYALIRIDQLFDIIIEYPESEPAMNDLKSCIVSIDKNDLRSTLVKSLKSALETRLLHPGVNTSDILTAYISAIRALRLLDPSGVILELVCEPVRKYLRSREDTVRSIVASLTDDSTSELSEELFKGNSLVLDDSFNSDEDDKDWVSWTPDPVDADIGKNSKNRRSSDIISMLVNIYGSKELFVNEYRTLLADRILTHYNYDTQREIRYLELLKIRFGELSLHYCEVMLKDVADSRRINAVIEEKREKPEENGAEGGEQNSTNDIPITGMILSAQFWPPFREERVELPAVMQKSLDVYTKSYESLKGNRTLSWKPHLGLINIDIELKDGQVLNMNVSPVHAAIIMQFQDQTKWSIDELSSKLQMPTSALRRKIMYWQSQGLLKEESTDTYVLVEEQKGGKTHDVSMEEEDMESAMASSHDQREEELQVFWSYIVGMLTNLDSLSLERIHTMLKMFAMQGPCSPECSVQELKAFLGKRVKEQKLVFSGGVYRLPKPGT